MAKKYRTVTYHSKKELLHVLIEAKIDFPITVKLEGRVWNYKTRDDVPRRIESGDKYFRRMTFNERIKIAEMTVQNSVNKHLSDGTLIKPQSKMEEIKVGEFIFKETRKAANELKGKLVIDTR